MSQGEGGGRPTKICPEVRAKIISAISKNLPYQMAAWHARISESTLYGWLRHGLEDIENGIDSEFSKFLQDIKEAESHKIVGHMDALEEQSERWQSRAWILERRWRNQFTDKAAEIEFRERLEKLEESRKGEADNGQST